jgi:hypothetical protein
MQIIAAKQKMPAGHSASGTPQQGGFIATHGPGRQKYHNNLYAVSQSV